MQQKILGGNSSNTNNRFKKWYCFNKAQSSGLQMKTSRKKGKQNERKKYLQRIYQIKVLNPECARIPKKQPNLKISNISKCKEDREISNKDP